MFNSTYVYPVAFNNGRGRDRLLYLPTFGLFSLNAYLIFDERSCNGTTKF